MAWQRRLGHRRCRHQGFVLAQPAVDDAQQLIHVERFGEKIESAELHRLDGGVDRAVAGDDDRNDAGIDPRELLQHLDPADARHTEIEEDHARPGVFHEVEALHPIGRHQGVVAPALQRLPAALANGILVVDNDHIHAGTMGRL